MLVNKDSLINYIKNHLGKCSCGEFINYYYCKLIARRKYIQSSDPKYSTVSHDDMIWQGILNFGEDNIIQQIEIILEIRTPQPEYSKVFYISNNHIKNNTCLEKFRITIAENHPSSKSLHRKITNLLKINQCKSIVLIDLDKDCISEESYTRLYNEIITKYSSGLRIIIKTIGGHHVHIDRGLVEVDKKDIDILDSKYRTPNRFDNGIEIKGTHDRVCSLYNNHCSPAIGITQGGFEVILIDY